VFRGFGPASLPTATTRERGRLSLIASIGQEVLGVSGDPSVGQERLQVHLVRGQSHQQRTRETSWTGRRQAPERRDGQLLPHLLAAGLQPGDDVGVLGGHQAVHDELARLQAPIEAPEPAPAPAPTLYRPPSGQSNGNGPTTHQPAVRSRTRKPATEKQIRAISSIARQQHADLDGLLRQEFAVLRPEDLSLQQASKLIDILKTASQI
jgi:hypothetical protein